MLQLVFLIAIYLCTQITHIHAHGRLLDPPARSTAWREDPSRFPAFYDDNSMFCGGFYTQWTTHNGKCGICGDEYGKEKFTKGGSLYRGYNVRSYTSGQLINVLVEMTANHLGYFEFRICNTDNLQGQDATQSCLDRTVLSDKLGRKQFYIGSRLGRINIQLVLPRGLVCKHCVFQWKYNAGNSWNVDPVTKKGCLGCGPQEQFYGCSDVAIKSSLKRVEEYEPAEESWDKKSQVDESSSISVPTSVFKRLIGELKRLKDLERLFESNRNHQQQSNEDSVTAENRSIVDWDGFEDLVEKRDAVIFPPSSEYQDLEIRK